MHSKSSTKTRQCMQVKNEKGDITLFIISDIPVWYLTLQDNEKEALQCLWNYSYPLKNVHWCFYYISW